MKEFCHVDENNVKIFTYRDYVFYSRKLNCNCGLAEESEEYILKPIHQYKDKGYKIVLSNKNEL